MTCQDRAKELQGEVGRLADLLTASECEALQTASELRDLKARLPKAPKHSIASQSLALKVILLYNIYKYFTTNLIES